MHNTREFQVALSFAGEDRSVADELAAVLRKYDVRVFYDMAEQATLWAINLPSWSGTEK